MYTWTCNEYGRHFCCFTLTHSTHTHTLTASQLPASCDENINRVKKWRKKNSNCKLWKVSFSRLRHTVCLWVATISMLANSQLMSQLVCVRSVFYLFLKSTLSLSLCSAYCSFNIETKWNSNVLFVLLASIKQPIPICFYRARLLRVYIFGLHIFGAVGQTCRNRCLTNFSCRRKMSARLTFFGARANSNGAIDEVRFVH